eukprot:Colp12_sorted_trinity150504_noHs@30701
MANNANREELERLMTLEGNDVCADCKSKDPDWASANLGVFVCIECSGIHRNLGTHISKVRSVRLDMWPDDLVANMRNIGNLKANEQYEANVPFTYKRPSQKDSYVLREQWIRAKYERKEFCPGGQPLPYLSGEKEGFLTKKGKSNSSWAKRWFILKDNKLSYYIKKDGPPKDTLPIDEVNVTVATEKTGKPNSMQIVCMNRNYFVYAETGKDIVDWLNAIRAARAKFFGIAPDIPAERVCRELSRDFVMEGYLTKLGDLKRGTKRRWFTLDPPMLYYYADPLDAEPLGKVLIGHKDDGYVVEEMEKSAKIEGYGFSIHEPRIPRVYQLVAETKEKKSSWIRVLRDIINSDENLLPRGKGLESSLSVESMSQL